MRAGNGDDDGQSDCGKNSKRDAFEVEIAVAHIECHASPAKATTTAAMVRQASFLPAKPGNYCGGHQGEQIEDQYCQSERN